MKRLLLPFSLALLLLSVTCVRDTQDIPVKIINEALTVIDQGFSKYISAYTSGIIPANSAIEIVFTKEFASLVDRKRTSNLFSFTPSLKGTAEWIDDITLVFRPAEPLKAGTSYHGTLNIAKLGSTENRFRTFPLSVSTVVKNFSVTLNPISCDLPAGETYTISGTVATADYTEPKEVEDYVAVKHGRKDEAIRWEHDRGNSHSFFIEKVAREKESNKLIVSWNGNSYGAKSKGEEEIIIPAAGLFTATGIRVNTGETKSIEIIFSDQLDASAELEGMVTLNPEHDIICEVEGNKLIVVPADLVLGEATLTIDGSLTNNKGVKLGSDYTQDINFTPIEPGLKAVGKGVIMPSSGDLIYPFMAANLSAADLTIIKIFENNLPYFLQENNMGDASPYTSVRNFGRPVYRGRIKLTGDASFDPNKYNMFTINLADYITVEQGILYRVELSMRPSYSLYPCKESKGKSRYEEMLETLDQDKEWEGSENYYQYSEDHYFYEYAYDWDENGDPCSDSYFQPNKKLVRNILASDYGLMAKCGIDNNLRVFVNDLKTTQPVSSVTVDVFDFQNQLVGSAPTDKDGIAIVSCPRKPYLVIAHKDKNRNYLSLADGQAMSMSSFDVTGEMPQNGIRAFLYTERDVRRPGDTIYLGVIARDVATGLPAGHPVHFELYNPSGQRIDDQVSILNDKGFLTFITTTDAEAVTGNYRAQVSIGGATFSKTLKVETVKPNRLKIQLTFPSEILGGESNEITAALKASWLNGAVAGDLRAKVDMLLRPVKTTFDRYNQYCFDDPASKFWFESTTIFDDKISATGDATVAYSPDDQLKAPGMLNAIFTAQVFEKGGDASITQIIKPFAPYPEFVGINIPALGSTGRMLYTDSENEVKIVTVDKAGKPIRGEVEVVVYKLDYRWWWESDDEYLGSYISNERYAPVFSQTILTTGGEGRLSFKIDKENWGRYMVRATMPSGHSTGKIILVDWPWDYGMKPGGNDGASLLQINTDKDKYNTGDQISLSFPSPANGRAIVSIENSTKILDVKQISTDGGNTTVKITATPDMAPNAYVYVTLLQPHSQTVNDAPIRLYGVVPVMVEDPETHITPVITMPSEIRSKQEVEVKVTEQNRKEMTYTLAIVDEGLLDITAFRTPDPWKWFFVRQALGVRTWDLYDYVFGAFGGTLGRVFAVGGDLAVVDQSKNKAKRFVPVVKFIGPFTIAPGKTGTHKIRLPQYTGSVRVMVVGAGKGNTFGSSEKSVIVSDPLMILATAPRVLSPGDRVALPVTIFSQSKEPVDVNVTVTGNEMVSFFQNKASAHFTGQGEKDIQFIVATANKTGIAKIKVEATAGAEKAYYDLEIEVRSPNPAEGRSEIKLVQPGENYEKSFVPFGMEGTSKASVEIFTLPSVNLTKRLAYLTSYPHGCTEQITSAAFPQIYLPELLGNSLPDEANVKNNIQSAIRNISSRQLSSGALTLWPGSAYPDDWATSYAGHFLIEAQKAGYSVPAGLMNKWNKYQRSAASLWRYQPQYRYTCNDQAYRLFTLALAGTPEKGAMNRMKEIKELPSLSRWLLAAAYATTGRTEVSQTLIDVRNLKSEDEYSYYYYGSSLRDRSVILYTLTTLGKTTEAMTLLKEICDEMGSDRWYSTQTTAWSLFAYMNFSHKIKAGSDKEIKTSVTINGNKEALTSSGNALLRDFKPVTTTNTISVKNESKTPLFITFTERGVPLSSDATVAEVNMTMKVDYLAMDGKPIEPYSLVQGTGFMMVVAVTNTSHTHYDNLALSQMVPSGWEIQNTRLFETVMPIRESAFDSRDFRDDRVYTYFSLNPGETKRYYIILTASYRGTYSMPSVLCEAMYDDGIRARRPGREVNVTEPK